LILIDLFLIIFIVTSSPYTFFNAIIFLSNLFEAFFSFPKFSFANSKLSKEWGFISFLIVIFLILANYSYLIFFLSFYSYFNKIKDFSASLRFLYSIYFFCNFSWRTNSCALCRACYYYMSFCFLFNTVSSVSSPLIYAISSSNFFN